MNSTQRPGQRYLVRPEGPRTTVPVHLPMERAWQWCIAATLRDLRISITRSRTISLPSTRRLWRRRWTEVCWANDLPEASPWTASRQSQGAAAVTTGYVRELRRQRLPSRPLTGCRHRSMPQS